MTNGEVGCQMVNDHVHVAFEEVALVQYLIVLFNIADVLIVANTNGTCYLVCVAAFVIPPRC